LQITFGTFVRAAWPVMAIFAVIVGLLVLAYRLGILP
jgi:hypothetical protein